MPSKRRVLVGPDLGDHPAQEHPDDRPSDHAFHTLIGHEPEEKAEQERHRDVDQPTDAYRAAVQVQASFSKVRRGARQSAVLRAEVIES